MKLTHLTYRILASVLILASLMAAHCCVAESTQSNASKTPVPSAKRSTRPDVESRAWKAWDSTPDRGNPDVLDRFFRLYPDTGAARVAFAIRMLSAQSDSGSAEDTAALDEFIQRYADTPGAQLAIQWAYEITSRRAHNVRLNPARAIAEYAAFVDKYPLSTQAIVAEHKIQAIEFSQIQNSSAPDVFLSFAEKYPFSPLADTAVLKATQLSASALFKRGDELKALINAKANPNVIDAKKDAIKTQLSNLKLKWSQVDQPLFDNLRQLVKAQSFNDLMAGKAANKNDIIPKDKIEGFIEEVLFPQQGDSDRDSNLILLLHRRRHYEAVLETVIEYYAKQSLAGHFFEPLNAYQVAKQARTANNVMFDIVIHLKIIDKTVTRSAESLREVIRQEHAATRKAMESGFQRLGLAIQGLDKKLQAIDNSVKNVEQGIQGLRGDVQAFKADVKMSLATMNDRLSGIDTELKKVNSTLEKVHTGIQGLKDEVKVVGTQVQALRSDIRRYNKKRNFSIDPSDIIRRGVAFAERGRKTFSKEIGRQAHRAKSLGKKLHKRGFGAVVPPHKIVAAQLEAALARLVPMRFQDIGKFTAYERVDHVVLSMNLGKQNVYGYIERHGVRYDTETIANSLFGNTRIPKVNLTNLSTAPIDHWIMREDDYKRYRDSKYQKYGARCIVASFRVVDWASPSTITRLVASYVFQQDSAATGEILDLLALEASDWLMWAENCLKSPQAVFTKDIIPQSIRLRDGMLEFHHKNMTVQREFVEFRKYLGRVEIHPKRRGHHAVTMIVKPDLVKKDAFQVALQRFDERCRPYDKKAAQSALENAVIAAAWEKAKGNGWGTAANSAGKVQILKKLFVKLATAMNINQAMLTEFRSDETSIIDLRGSSAANALQNLLGKQLYDKAIDDNVSSLDIEVDTLDFDLANYRLTARLSVRHRVYFDVAELYGMWSKKLNERIVSLTGEFNADGEMLERLSAIRLERPSDAEGILSSVVQMFHSVSTPNVFAKYDKACFSKGDLVELAINDVLYRRFKSSVDRATGPELQRLSGQYSTKSVSFEDVNPQLGGEPVYYVNGINTKKKGNAEKGKFEAFEQAEALSVRLARPVRLIHNPTADIASDMQQALEDRIWRPPFPQPNGTTKAVVRVLLDSHEKSQKVSLCAHSQGSIIARNAILTMEALGYGAWVRSNVRWVVCGTPLRNSEFPELQPTVVNQSHDPINLVGRVEYAEGADVDAHSFVESYVRYIQNEMFWPSNNRHIEGTRPLGTTGLYDRYLFK